MLNLYATLINPRSKNQDARNRELVLNYILLGLLTLVALEFVASLFGFLYLRQHYLVFRLLGILAVLVAFSYLYWLARVRQKQRPVAAVIVIFLLLLVSLVVLEWGTVTPTGTLLFGLVIVISGILLGSRYALYAALVSSVILALFEYLKVRGVVVPNLTWTKRPSSMSDIFGFAIIYAIMALILWLYNQQMEQSLWRAQKSEAALSRQKDLLEETVKERTKQLEQAQLEKLQQIYRFAELGRISSALFHDLANHLTTVSLDIEGLGRSQQSDLMKRVQHDIGYIDNIVQRVRLQLRGQGTIERFKVSKEVRTVTKSLSYKLTQMGIKLELDMPVEPIYFTGDAIPFRQIISNLLGNAIEAYSMQPETPKPRIRLTLTNNKSTFTINVQDWGVGISAAKQKKIFEPFYSSKVDGTGIGLFIVKQIVTHDLGGKIAVTSDPKTGTCFYVTLPRSNEER